MTSPPAPPLRAVGGVRAGEEERGRRLPWRSLGAPPPPIRQAPRVDRAPPLGPETELRGLRPGHAPRPDGPARSAAPPIRAQRVPRRTRCLVARNRGTLGRSPVPLPLDCRARRSFALRAR